jgi:hypothetical protein
LQQHYTKHIVLFGSHTHFKVEPIMNEDFDRRIWGWSGSGHMCACGCTEYNATFDEVVKSISHWKNSKDMKYFIVNAKGVRVRLEDADRIRKLIQL